MTAIDPTTTQITPAGSGEVVLSDYTVASLTELLGMCEEFLRTAGPAVHAELRGYLRTHAADTVWLIDMLGFNNLHLTRELDHQTNRAGRDTLSRPGFRCLHQTRGGTRSPARMASRSSTR